MVYIDENGYERWRLLSHEERVGQNRWEELLEYTDAFEYWHRIRAEYSNIDEVRYTDIKEDGIYFRVFQHAKIDWRKSKKSTNPSIHIPLENMAPIGSLRILSRKENKYKIAFAVEKGLKVGSIVCPYPCLVQIDPSIKAEEAMACIAARSLETFIERIEPVCSPLKRLVFRIENDVERKPLRANFNVQRCKDAFERRHYTQLTVYITCTDDQALVRLKERIPAYEVVIEREYEGRRVLKLVVPRFGREEEALGSLRCKYDGVRLYPA